jgi:hypothetical protein
MNKNVLLVLAIILIPIVILGVLAVSGAEKFAEQKENVEHEEETNTTEAAHILVPLKMVKVVSAQAGIMAAQTNGQDLS